MTYPGFFFVFPYKVENYSFKISNVLCWYLVESVDCFGKMAIFIMFFLWIHEHGQSFYLWISSSIFFFRYLKFLPYKYFTCLFKIMSRYIILFIHIVKWGLYLLCQYSRGRRGVALYDLDTSLFYVLNSRSSRIPEWDDV